MSDTAELDETALLARSDAVVRALRDWTVGRIHELRVEHALHDAPHNPSDRRRWALGLDEVRGGAFAEIERLSRIRRAANLAWGEDRWADIGELGHRYRAQLPDDVAAAAHHLCEAARAFPGRGRAQQPNPLP